VEFMQFLVARKHLISFACNIGYKSAQDLREIASQVPLENLMIETDSPFLPPKNHRGKPNSSVHVREVALVLSEMHKVDYDTFAQQMQDNFDRFFHAKEPLLAE
jgi:TatD DNase family protein